MLAGFAANGANLTINILYRQPVNWRHTFFISLTQCLIGLCFHEKESFTAVLHHVDFTCVSVKASHDRRHNYHRKLTTLASYGLLVELIEEYRLLPILTPPD